ncbi:MAG TPA: outer membrane lipoprotein-sorting protein [Myxococcota bacterium]|nr:outer membrane lipoprotein-sorting protein [Myxococcota bacterium]HRY93612.1 outer membrane lipoprotein-sorting protein [Myxococcota bacterium]
MTKGIVAMVSLLCATPCDSRKTPQSEGPPNSLIERLQPAFRATNLRANGVLNTTDATGGTKSMKFVFFNKNDSAGIHQRRLLAFIAPSEMRGTSLLAIQEQWSQQNIWSYSPLFQRARPLAADEFMDSIVGSDLFYVDLFFPCDELFLHRVVRTETLPEGETLVVETTPKRAAGMSWYGRTLSWVGKNMQYITKVEFYDHQGKLLKTLLASEPREIDPGLHLWLPTHLSITNNQNLHRTDVVIESATTDLEIQDDLFTTEHLERGRRGGLDAPSE